jgi:diacylglycerol O-acyltransferase
MTTTVVGTTHEQRLSALDAAFWELESDAAPMHVGWVAELEAPTGGRTPSLAQLRCHVDARLARAPRFRQRIASIDGVPSWVDDPLFDIVHHVRRSGAADLDAFADEILSAPLRADRPPWELWVADRLDGGRIGIVGKAHHGLVDGLAAVAFMTLLLDDASQTDDVPREQRRHLTPRPSQAPALARSPRHVQGHMRRARGYAHVLAATALPLAPPSLLNGPLAPGRHLAHVTRPLGDLRSIEHGFTTTINDVLLAATAGAVRDLFLVHGERPIALKSMVPVSVRGDQERWGNRIAFVFPWLPCDEPDPRRRLAGVHGAMREHKLHGAPASADTMIGAIGHAPHPLRTAASRVLNSPRLFNLTISNVPGPEGPLSLMGCRVLRAYPAVPLAAGHRFSIGMTSVNDIACVGVFADAAYSADAERLAARLGAAIDELLAAGGDDELAA